MEGVNSGYVRSTLDVVSALEAVVLRSFGPNGGVVLFTRDTGEVLLTRQGQKILKSLHLEHPVARMVVDCIQAHCTMTADGAKSFLLLLASLLRGIHAHNKACRGISNAHVRHLANQLLHLCYDGLDDIIMHQVTPSISLLYSSSYHGDTLEGLVCGYMAGRVGIGQAEVLVPIICEFFRKWNVGQGMVETIRFIHTHFHLLHTTVLGLPVGRSCVQEGFLLGCDWTVFFQPKNKGPIRVLVLNESVFAVDETVSVFENYMGDSHVTALRRLCVCAEELDVCALLSPVKCSDVLLQWARQKQLCVAECVDPPLLDLLCQISQSQPAPVGRVATVTSVCRVVLGGHRLGCVGVLPTHTSHTHSPSEHILLPHTLLLCSPGPGPLDQCVNTCQGVFTMLHSVCEDQPQTSHTDQSEDASPHTVQSYPFTENSEQSLPLPSDHWTQLLHAGRMVPVGGVFEVLLHHFLLTSDWVAEPQVRKLLAESVLVMPRTLHSHKPHLFLQFQASLLDKLHSGLPTKPWRGELESVSCKQQLLASVLQCVCKLLSVDRVLYTHTPLHRHSPATETSDHED